MLEMLDVIVKYFEFYHRYILWVWSQQKFYKLYFVCEKDVPRETQQKLLIPCLYKLIN